MDVAGLQQRLQSAGQEHLLQFWDSLQDNEKQSLYNELNHLDFIEINSYFEAAMQSLKNASEKIDDLLEPLPPVVCGSVTRTDDAKQVEYTNMGKATDCFISYCLNMVLEILLVNHKYICSCLT